MASYRALYSILLILTAAFSQIYMGHLSSVIFISTAALPMVTLILAIVGRAAVSVEIDRKKTVVEKGDPVKVNIFVKNRFIFPCSSVMINVFLPDPSDKKNARLIFSLSPLQKKCLNISFAADYRGEYSFLARDIYVYDLLKLFRLKKKIDLSKSVTVCPRLFDVQSGGAPTSFSAEKTSPNSVLYSGEKSFVRKYEEGDDVRRIHWKLSSKQEDYMVWQQTEGSPARTLIIFDLSKKGDSETENARLTDAVIEAALATALCSIRSGRACALEFFDKATNSRGEIFINGVSDIFKAVIDAAALKSYRSPPDFLSAAEPLRSRSENDDSIILITHTVDTELARDIYDLDASGKNVSLLYIENGKKLSDECEKLLKEIKFSSLPPKDFPNLIGEAVKKVCGERISK